MEVPARRGHEGLGEVEAEGLGDRQEEFVAVEVAVGQGVVALAMLVTVGGELDGQADVAEDVDVALDGAAVAAEVAGEIVEGHAEAVRLEESAPATTGV